MCSIQEEHSKTLEDLTYLQSQVEQNRLEER